MFFKSCGSCHAGLHSQRCQVTLTRAGHSKPQLSNLRFHSYLLVSASWLYFVFIILSTMKVVLVVALLWACTVASPPSSITLNTVIRDFTPTTNPDFERYLGDDSTFYFQNSIFYTTQEVLSVSPKMPMANQHSGDFLEEFFFVDNVLSELEHTQQPLPRFNPSNSGTEILPK